MLRPDEQDYSSLRIEYSNPFSLQARKVRMVLATIEGGESLLDVGSGEGTWAELALSKYRRVTLVETNPTAVSLLQERFKHESHAEIIPTSLEEYAKESREGPCFDAITLLDVLEHLENPAAALSIGFDLLRPGGTVIATMPNWYDFIAIHLGRSKLHHQAHSSVGWMKVIRRAGFAIECLRTVAFPAVRSDFLCRNFHWLGMCVMIVGRKPVRVEASSTSRNE